MKHRITVHIGLEKTGTTSLQNYLVANRAALLRAGCLYPVHNKGFFKNNHAPLAACYLPEARQDPTMVRSRRSRPEVLRSLRREVARSRAPHVLLSAEHFSSRFDAAAIQALADDFADHEVRILAVVRDHPARLFSSYSTFVDAGGEWRLDVYAASLLDPASHYLRIAETLSLWETVFGRDRVDLMDYGRHPDIIPPFTALLGLPGPVSGAPPRRRDKLALSPAGAEAVRLCNASVRTRQRGSASPSRPRWMQRRFFQRRLAARLAAVDAAAGGGAWVLSAGHGAALEALAANDRTWLQETRGLDLVRAPRRHLLAGDRDDDLVAERASDHVLAAALSRCGGLLWPLSEALVWLAELFAAGRRP